MNRTVSILLGAAIVGCETLESNNTALIASLIWNSALTMLLTVLVVLYCLFAAVHAVQRLSCPKKRAIWMIITLGFNIPGSCIYYCTKYQEFRREGKGGLIK